MESILSKMINPHILAVMIYHSILLGKDLQVAFEPKFFASEITLNCIYCSIIPVIKGVVVLSEVNFPNMNNSIKTTNEAIGKYLNI